MAKRIKEGRRLNLPAYDSIVPYIMVERSESENNISLSFPCDGVETLVRKLRADGYDSIGFLHVIIAAYVRTISQRPRINRFIRGQRIYARNGIVVNMVVKRKMNIDEVDTVIKMHFNPTDSIFDVYEEVNSKINEAFDNTDSNFDKTAKLLNYVPSVIKKNMFWWLKLIDYFGLIPRTLVSVSPFHGSMFLTNLASINIPPVRHHLYNFGNVPIFLAFGAKRNVLTLDDEGAVHKERVFDLVFSLDERICDGFYFASALKLFRKYITSPEILLDPPAEVVEDR